MVNWRSTVADATWVSVCRVPWVETHGYGLASRCDGERGIRSPVEVAFPDGNHLPADALEIAAFAGVAGDVAIEFGLPEGGVVLGKRVVTSRATVPVAAVDEDGEFL